MYEFDAVLQELGEFGRYQWFVFWLLCIFASFVNAYNGFALVFLALTPDHKCNLIEENSTTIQNETLQIFNITAEECEIKTLYIPNNNVNSTTTDCLYGLNYSKEYVEETIITQWDLVCSRAFIPKLFISLLGVSVIVGSLIMSHVQDKYGRKIAFLIALTIYLLGNFLAQFAPNFQTFAVARAITQFPSAMTWNVAYVWSQEYCKSKYFSEKFFFFF